MEQIKQEIINNIYENGENLITGPVLQTVLLDMVDDVNSKVASASVAPDIVDKTGSWDDAADWVEENSSSLVHENDLDGYATEQWVENQGYLKEHQDLGGYATTESLNDLSESVANDLANLPEPDLSDYATKEYVEATSASVKEWVENKHYLTTASLSGSVTEESVQFMINDATSSVKTWVGDQNYATETFVSQAIAEIPGTDLTGYATEQWVEEQGYLKEHQDISGLATTESVTSLSESVAQDFANLNIPDVSGLATTSSLNSVSQSISQSIDALAGNVADKAEARDLTSLSESVATDLGLLDERVTDVEDGKVDWDTYNADSASFDQRINEITGSDLSGYATTQSVNTLSASFAETIDNIPGTDLTGYATEQWVENQGYLTEHQDISGLATTSSVSALSSSVSSDIQSAREEASQAITGLGTIVEGVSDRVTGLSASFDDRINNITGSSVDLSGYATTQSVNALSASFDQRLLSASGLTYQDLNDLGLVYDTDGEGNWSARLVPEEGTGSFDEEAPAIWRLLRDKNFIGVEEDENGWRISYILESGEWIDNPVGKFLDAISEGKLATLELPEGAEQDIWVSPIVGEVAGKLNTSSFNTVSASFDQRINSITASGGSGVDTDLRNFLFGVESQTLTGITGSCTNIYSVVSSDTTLGFSAVPDNGTSLGIVIKNEGSSNATITLPDTVTVGSATYNLITNGVDNSGSMSIPSGEYGDVVVTRQGTDLFVRTSINLEDVDIDLSGYATTASLNSVSQSLSASIAAGGVTLEQLQDLGLVYNNDGYWVAADDQEHGGLPIDGEGSFWTSAPAFWRNLASQNLIGYFEDYDRETDTTYWSLEDTIATAEWQDNPVGALLRYVSDEKLLNWSDEDGRWVSPIVGEVAGKLNTSSFNTVSASFDQRISSIPGSDIDLSEYATTESVNTLSASFDQRINSIPGSDIDLSGYATTESVNTLSASFAETIDNIPTGSGTSGNYLPITGGTLTGNLFVGGNNSIGVGSTKVGIRSLTVGDSATSTQNAHYGLAVGENCSTDVFGGVALGRETRVNSEPFGVAVGFRTRVDKMSGFAGGCLTTASGQFSFAAGFGAVSKGTGQVVLGSFNEIDGTGTGTGSYAVILGNGKSSTWNQDNPGDVVRSNGLAIKWDGGIDINYSGSTITLQDKLAELENSADISGLATTESVNNLSASFDQRINDLPGGEEIWVRGEGENSAVPSGSSCTAPGQFAIAQGDSTVASGEDSHAEGNRTVASGFNSHAEGSYTTASGPTSHAEGFGTKALELGSHAEGSGTRASANYSHAEGSGTIASGSYSHAEGDHTIASNYFEHAQGRYNATASSQIFSIGVGSGNTDRKNAISIITGSGEQSSASIYIYGVGTYDGINPEPGVNDIATVVNNLSSSLDLSGYATTQSLNVLNSRVTDLSSSFDTRISQIVAASGGLDPADFAGAPTIVYQTDGTTGLVGVNHYTGSEGQMQYPAFDDTAWQLENLDLTNFDRIECYFKNSSTNPATVVTVILDSAAAGSGADTYSGTSLCPRVGAGGGARDMYEVEIAVDTSKTKLQVPYQFRVDVSNNTYTDASGDGNYLYKIVGYPKIV